MILGAVAALILDYAAVAAMIALLVLDRWVGIRLGITLDLLLILVIAVVVADSMIAWLAGSRLDRRLARDMAAYTEARELYSHGRQHPPNSSDT
jgi:hypothetical protein